MIKIYTLNHTPGSKVFFVSDLHFGHAKLAEKRGYSSVEEHDKALISEWNSRVSSTDLVINLGDFILGKGSGAFEYLNELLEKLNGKQYFIFGNHNAGIKKAYRIAVDSFLGQTETEAEIYPVSYKNLTFVGNSALFKVKHGDNCKYTSFVFASHFAHRIWIDMNHGVFHACGHSHSNDPESNETFLKARRLDLGIENFGGPLDFDKFLAIMRTKSIDTIDHHSTLTNPSF